MARDTREPNAVGQEMKWRESIAAAAIGVSLLGFLFWLSGTRLPESPAPAEPAPAVETTPLPADEAPWADVG